MQTIWQSTAIRIIVALYYHHQTPPSLNSSLVRIRAINNKCAGVLIWYLFAYNMRCVSAWGRTPFAEGQFFVMSLQCNKMSHSLYQKRVEPRGWGRLKISQGWKCLTCLRKGWRNWSHRFEGAIEKYVKFNLYTQCLIKLYTQVIYIRLKRKIKLFQYYFINKMNEK